MGFRFPLNRANQALIVAAMAMLLVSFVGTATNIAVPVLEEEFSGDSLATISWVVSAFNVTLVTFMLLGGRLADRMGRKFIFLCGMLLFALGAALSGIAPDVGMIIAARVVQAVGAALVLPSSLAAVLPLFSEDRHATVVSMWSSMGILGAAAAPTVSAGLLQIASWRIVFLVAAPIALLAFVGGWFVLEGDQSTTRKEPLLILSGLTTVGALAALGLIASREGWNDPLIIPLGALATVQALVFVQRMIFRSEQHLVMSPAGSIEGAVPSSPLDLVGTIAGTTAVGGLVLVIVQGRVWGWTDPVILAVGILALVNGLLFVQSSLLNDEPLLDLRLFRIRSFTVVTLASALLATSTTASWFLYPLFMIEIWDYSIFQVGLAMTPGPLVLVVAAVSAGRFADKRGYRRMLVLGATLATLGTAWMAFWLAPDRSYWFAFLPGTVGIGLGMALMMGPGNSAALKDVPEPQLGAANAAYNTARIFGGALGVAVVASIIGDSIGVGRLDAFRVGWWTMVAAMAAAPAVLWFAYPRDSHRTVVAPTKVRHPSTRGLSTPRRMGFRYLGWVFSDALDGLRRMVMSALAAVFLAGIFLLVAWLLFTLFLLAPEPGRV